MNIHFNRNFTAAVALVVAAVAAFYNLPGWGWFLFLAFIII